ncbi:MAG: hypothetical protein WAT39_08955 [Planctomycetota bacterium]
MYFFRLQALPDPRAKRDPAAIGAIGAFVNVWIDFAEQEGAEVLARHYVKLAGWLPQQVEDVRCPDVCDYDHDDDSRRYFEQATEHGYCVSFYLYSEKRD